MCALVVPSGGLISQVNGTVDNKVYYRGRWGNVVRTWVDPVNTITPQRTAVRALFASLQSLFNSLTPDMQDDWNAFAGSLVNFNRLAQPYIPTGLQTFMQRNMNLAVVSEAPLLLPPFDIKTDSIIALTPDPFTTTSLNVTTTFDDNTTSTPGNARLAYYGTNNVNAGLNNKTNEFRFIQYVPGSFSTVFDLFSPWSSAWFPSLPISGKKIFIKAVLINTDTGRASAPAFCSQIII